MEVSMMTIFKPLCFMVVIAVIIPRIYGNVEEEDWFKRKLAESYNASLKAYHHDPFEVVNHLNEHVHMALEEEASQSNSNSNSNSTRRELGVKYKGECKAQNPMDRCWRCKDNWEKNRKRLVHCVKGFGRNTTGGLEGEFYTVTDDSDEDIVEPKPGTLRYAVLQPRPLWIIFDRDMTIKLKAELLMTSDKTIDGRGYMIHIAQGAGITLQLVSNVIIHNLKIHDIVPGSGGNMRSSFDHVGIRGVDDGDGISMFGAHNVWIDHLSMWNCSDGLIDVVKGSTGITISNGHFTKHDHVFLFGASDSDPEDKVMQITLAFNNFGKGLVQRMPRCRWGFFHVVNNDYTHWLMYAVGGSSAPTIISHGNRFIAPPDPNAKSVTHRNGVNEDDWKNWMWKSEKDLFINGAYFIESGPPFKKPNKKDFVKAKEGSYVRRLTRFAGYLMCIKDRKCQIMLLNMYFFFFYVECAFCFANNCRGKTL